MASGEDPCPEHLEVTRRNHYRYCFFRDHHGRGALDDAQWAADVSPDEEFSIFDEADWHELIDLKGHLYGLRTRPRNIILDLGSAGEQIAKFWNPRKDQPTHGFPLWPLAQGTAPNRKEPIPKSILIRMESEGLLLEAQRRRLAKGERV